MDGGEPPARAERRARRSTSVCAPSRAPALRSCVVVPLVESDALVAVLGIYSTNAAGFTEDHLRLLEVLGSRLAAALVDAAIADEDSQAFPVVRPRSLKLVQTS